MRAAWSIEVVEGIADEEDASAVEARLGATGAGEEMGVGADLHRVTMEGKKDGAAEG